MKNKVGHDFLLNKSHSLSSKGTRKHTWIGFALLNGSQLKQVRGQQPNPCATLPISLLYSVYWRPACSIL